MHRKLNIRAAGLDPHFANHRNGGIAHGLIFAVGERLRRGHGDGIAGMHAHGIEILDGANHDHVISEIAHHLQLVLFPPQHRFFDQHFVHRREIEAAAENLQQLFPVIGDAAAGAAERERWTNHHRKTDLAGEVETVFEVIDQRRFGHIETDFGHGVFEEQPVFRHLDGPELRANQFDVVFLQHAGIGQLYCQIKRGLSADGGQQGKNSPAGDAGTHLRFNANDFFQILACERLDISAVGHLRISHDGGRIRVHQHHFVSFRFQRLAGLRARVIEFRGLADDDRPRADDHDFGDIVAARHYCVVTS